MGHTNQPHTAKFLTAVLLLCSLLFMALSCYREAPLETAPQEEATKPAEQEPVSEQVPEVEKTPAEESGVTEEPEPLVHSITIIVNQQGGRVDWGKNNLIAHSRFGQDGYYDLWVMDSDGSSAKCLTCDNPRIPQLHNGQPAWHPSGRYIVFQSQDPSLPHTRQEDNRQTQPGFGKHNNLWVTDPEGKNFYQLTSIKQNGAILHAHSSHDGLKLTWAEKIGIGASDWAIMIADFVEIPQPHLENITPYQPLGNVWYETHDFSPDDSRVLFTAGTGATSWSGFDIWDMEIATQKLNRLTSDPEIWDEHAHYSPDGEKIVWASSREYPYDPSTFDKAVATLKLDYWIMDADGLNKQRLTYFNEPRHEHYMGYTSIVADCSWSPDGRKIVASVLCGQGRASTRIVVIELNDIALESAFPQTSKQNARI
jgi:Tol biopolymer transport system component